MRVMAYIAGLVALLMLWAAWLLHKRTFAESKRFLRLSIWAIVAPFAMNTAGWFLTENGRQPWIVQGVMKTVNGASPAVSSADTLDQPDRLRADLHPRRRGRCVPDDPLRPQWFAR